MAFSNGKKAFSLPADVRCALTDMSVTSEEEQIPSGEACGPADTDPRYHSEERVDGHSYRLLQRTETLNCQTRLLVSGGSSLVEV